MSSPQNSYVHGVGTQPLLPLTVDGLLRQTAERLPHAVETTLYRILQEALTNIAKHAEAKTASVMIRANSPW